jgi:hypothetical protein
MLTELVNKTISESLLGKIVLETAHFAYESKYNMGHIITDDVSAGERRQAINYFNKMPFGQYNYYVKNEYLPADPNIRAVAVRNNKLLIEVTMFNSEIFEEELSKVGLPFTLKQPRGDHKLGRQIYYGNEIILSSKTINCGKSDYHDMRSLIKVVPNYSSNEFMYAVASIAVLDKQSCYDDEQPVLKSFSSQNIMHISQRMELRTELLQILDILQQPRLAMQQTVSYDFLKRIEFLKIPTKSLAAKVKQELKDNPLLRKE